jgi:hypothetical protein
MLPSLAVMLMATAVEPRVPFGYADPVRDFLWPYFSQGRFAIQIFGTFSHVLLTENSVAFNWGKLLGLAPQLQLLPLLGLWLFATARLQSLLALRRWAALGLAASVTLPFLAPLYFVPESAPSSGSQGLRGVYYSGEGWLDSQVRNPAAKTTNKSGSFTRIDRQINFDWVRDGFPMQVAFCAEWRGTLLVPQTGSYEFAISSDDGSLLFLDERLLIDNWGMHGFEEKRGVLDLPQSPQRIMLRYCDKIMGGGVKLLWRKLSPGPAETLRYVEPQYLRPE